MHVYGNTQHYLNNMGGNSIIPMLVSVLAGNRGHTQIRVIGESLRTYYKGRTGCRKNTRISTVSCTSDGRAITISRAEQASGGFS